MYNSCDYDDEGEYCPHCGEYLPMEVGMGFHTCPGLKAENKRKQAEEAARYNGTGKTRKGVLIINYECRDSAPAFEDMMTILSLNGVFKTSGIWTDKSSNFLDPTLKDPKLKFTAIHKQKII